MTGTPDLDLARALEGAEAAACGALCLAAAEVHPGQGIRAIASGGGFGLFYGRADPLNAVKGVGLAGAVDLDEWSELERFFQEARSPVVVDLCPLADEAFVAHLGEQGYRIGSFETVTFRSLDGDLPDPPLPLGCRIGPPEDPGVCTRVINVGFADGGEPIKFSVDFGRVRAKLAGSFMLLATINDEPVGGAVMSISNGVAHMGGAAVLPGFRGRGIQASLTAARLGIARERGCVLAKLDVRAGSGSHRNAVRGGFQVAYTRPQMIRAW